MGRMTLVFILIAAATVWTVVMSIAIRHASDDDDFIARLNETEGDG